MHALLDSYALLWWLADEPMDAAAAAVIADGDALVAVSTATVWELAIKRAIGKLRFGGSLVDAVAGEGFETLTISPAHAELAGGLPRHHHRDPFDRMLIAKAQAEGLTIITRDPAFEAYDVPILRC